MQVNYRNTIIPLIALVGIGLIRWLGVIGLRYDLFYWTPDHSSVQFPFYTIFALSVIVLGVVGGTIRYKYPDVNGLKLMMLISMFVLALNLWLNGIP